MKLLIYYDSNIILIDNQTDRARKDSRRIEMKRKFWEEARQVLYLGGEVEEEHLVGRYPGNAHSSFS
jgi:hypothetical protein